MTSGMGSGTGGSNPTGGSTGTGGGSGSCTGGNSGVNHRDGQLCDDLLPHPGRQNAGTSGGLDLTRRQHRRAPGWRHLGWGRSTNASECMANTTPYLNAGSNPATGLLIDKVTMTHPPCGGQMPDSAPFPLTATQQSCLIQWATTLTSP